MAINVLQYNQLARSIDAKKDLIAQARRDRDSADAECAGVPAAIDAQIALINQYDSAIDSAEGWSGSAGSVSSSGKLAGFQANPYCCCGWVQIPCFSDYTGVSGTTLCVWNTADGDFNLGACCEWTVPSGVTVAMFEVWGAGGASGAGNCCGFAPPGMSGAFTQSIIYVESGDVFTLCAGCAIKYCAYCTQTCISQSCPSFVCTNSLCGGTHCFCMCSRGGCHNACIEMEERTIVACGDNGAETCATASHGRYRYWGSCACICASGTYICGDNMNICGGNWSNGQPPHPSCRITGCVAQNTDSSGFDVRFCQNNAHDIMVPSVYGGGCFNGSFCGCYCYMGVPRWGCQCNCCFGSSICCGYTRRAACGCRCTVGQGASASWVCGGNTGIYGDYGRQGGIRVTYC